MGLPATSVVLNAGGKFTIIGPNTEAAQKAVEDVQQRIDHWFIRMTYGESGISLSAVPASPDDFKSRGFPLLQDRMNRKAMERKLNRIDLDRFGGVVQSYFDMQTGRHLPVLRQAPVGRTDFNV